MALIFFDGFDTYGTSNLLMEWVQSVGTNSINTTGGRRGGGALYSPDNASLNFTSAPSHIVSRSLPSNFTTFICGVAFESSGFHQPKNIFMFRDSGTRQLEVGVNTGGQLFVSRNGTILATSTASIAANVYNYIEIKATINNTTGSYEVRLNGANVLSATNVDTQNTSNAYINEVVLGAYLAYPGSITATTNKYDDFYFCDTTGSVNNNFLGDIRIDAIFPTADGNYSQWTPSTAGAHFSLVDENPPNTTDYVSDGTIGNKDSYVMQNPPSLVAQTIHAVKTRVAIQKDDAGARSVKIGVRSGTTNGLSSSIALGTSWAYVSHILETDPNTSAAWTASAVDNVEALIETA